MSTDPMAAGQQALAQFMQAWAAQAAAFGTQASELASNTLRGEPASPLPGGLRLDPGRVTELQSEYIARVQALAGGQEPVVGRDRRFASEAWHLGPFGASAALYELNAEFMTRMAGALEGDAKTRERVRFATQQWVDAMSPANYLISNPEALNRIVESGGKSLQDGIANLLADLSKGRISQSDEEAFEVGRNLAVTPGHVVFQNELIQLIQYAPSTSKVGARPMLMVPPCINKFYILDLQPQNSVVSFLVEQGHTVFMVSWRNPDASLGHLGWDDYLRLGPLEAIRVTREISGQDRINALGFCVGGTIIATALAALAARGEHPVESLTLLTTLLDFENPGVLNIFIDEQHVRFREATIGKGGLMAGGELAQTFSSLRPNDLVWNYVVGNYLKGEKPPAFDLLYWNADSTNLPGPMFAWYLRNMYLENRLREPGALRSLGEAIDLGAIDVPTFIYASREDHIVPWQAAYRSTELLSNDLRFVLGASGHIAGVINPLAKNKRNYWVNDNLVPEPHDWLESAKSMPGSWWADWRDWLLRHKGSEVDAPREPGNRDYPPLEAAPGSYVRQKA